VVYLVEIAAEGFRGFDGFNLGLKTLLLRVENLPTSFCFASKAGLFGAIVHFCDECCTLLTQF
jgi:hypothetical protein